MALNALPEILTNSSFRFILFDIPSEKQASSSQMYSLNVAPRHLESVCRSSRPGTERLRRHSEGSEC